MKSTMTPKVEKVTDKYGDTWFHVTDVDGEVYMYTRTGLAEAFGLAVDCCGHVVKAKYGLCIFCDGPLTKSSHDYGREEGGAHRKCHDEQCR